MNSNYKSALSRYTVSGTHTGDLFSFCNGDLEVYYLKLHLQQRPELNGMVEADLPPGCFLSSEQVSDRGGGFDSNKNPTSLSGSSNNDKKDCSHRKKRVKKESVCDDYYDDSQIAGAIRDLAHSQMLAEVTKQRIRYMESEDSLRSKKNALLNEWEKVHANIRLLRQDLLFDESVL